MNECKYIFDNYKNVNKIIYKDSNRYYEITKIECEEVIEDD